MKSFFAALLVIALFSGCIDSKEELLKKQICEDSRYDEVIALSEKLVASGFNAGDGYVEVWIRDLNTFITLSCKVNPQDKVEEHLSRFFLFQGEDGNIPDGYVTKRESDGAGYNYMKSPYTDAFVAYKNTVETDQETSLIQSIYKYIQTTGHKEYLNKIIEGETVLARMERAMDFLMNHRFDKTYGLLWGATTVDWGDVQPEHDWGVVLDENSHYAIDIYDNAMFVMALNNLIELAPDSRIEKRWKPIKNMITANVRTHIWDEKRQKFIPHIYLDGSPFPESFDENSIHFHGGTACAILAGFLSKEEVAAVNAQQVANVKESGAPSIGLTVYPVYPNGMFKNHGMQEYGYQNGGDWTWFGARMISALIQNGFIKEAVEEVEPMVARIVKNKAFYEYYDRDGTPKGSGSFRGEAGVMWTALTQLKEWAGCK